MGFMIRQIPETAKLTDEAALEALESALPEEVIASVVSDLGVAEERRRKLPADLTILLTVAMNLFTQQSLGQVLVKMLKGLRFLWPEPEFQTANKSAICQARYRLGARPLVELFHRVCKPLATPETKGAFLFGYRLMALDLTVEHVPDSPENAHAFGRHSTDRGQSAYPQVLCAYLEECGTHAITDAGVFPCHANQHASAQRLLRSLSAGMMGSFHRFRRPKRICTTNASINNARRSGSTGPRNQSRVRMATTTSTPTPSRRTTFSTAQPSFWERTAGQPVRLASLHACERSFAACAHRSRAGEGMEWQPAGSMDPVTEGSPEQSLDELVQELARIREAALEPLEIQALVPTLPTLAGLGVVRRRTKMDTALGRATEMAHVVREAVQRLDDDPTRPGPADPPSPAALAQMLFREHYDTRQLSAASARTWAQEKSGVADRQYRAYHEPRLLRLVAQAVLESRP